MRRIRLAEVEDHPLYLEGILSRISRQPDLIEIVATGNSGECLERILAEAEPDVILLDWVLPAKRDDHVRQGKAKYSTVGALERINQLESPPHILILSAETSAFTIQTALDLGADAYIVKDDVSSMDLADFIVRVWRGEMCLSPEANKILRESYLQDPPESPTDAEMDLARDILAYPGDKWLARAVRLGKSYGTVKNQRTSLYRKLRVTNKTDAVRRLEDMGVEPLFR